MAVTNTLAYYDTATIMTVHFFIHQKRGYAPLFGQAVSLASKCKTMG
jgi:hypothetical protein